MRRSCRALFMPSGVMIQYRRVYRANTVSEQQPLGPDQPPVPPHQTELLIAMNDEVLAVIARVMAEKDISASEVVRRAVAVYDYVLEETRAGSTVSVVRPDGHAAELWPL